MPDAPGTASTTPKTNDEPQRDSREETAAALAQEKPSRELTQTDQLNKQLLNSLLERMNAGDANIQRMMACDDSNEDTWETDDPDNDPPAT